MNEGKVTGPTMHVPATTRFIIEAPRNYARELQRLVELRGGQRKAARHWRVPQSQLSKVIHQNVRTVPRAWVEKIHGDPNLAREDREALDQCLMGSQAAALLHETGEWTKAELCRLGVALSEGRYHGGLVRAPGTKNGLISQAAAKARRDLASRVQPIGAQHGPAAERVRARPAREKLHSQAIWAMLEKLYSEEYLAPRGALFEFERTLIGQGFGDAKKRAEIRDRGQDYSALAILEFLQPRGILAILRSVEPLVEGSRSGFAERSWVELSQRELRQFLEASRKRELILLSRDPDVVRAQRQATRMFPHSIHDALERRSRTLARMYGSTRVERSPVHDWTGL